MNNKLKTFEQLSEDPYIVLVFNANISKNKPDGFLILRSEPIYDLKKIKKATMIVRHINTIMGMTVGKIIEMEKHNFSKWEELDIDWR